MPPHLLDDIDGQLAEWCAARKVPKFRVKQIRRWLFEGRAGDFNQMSDLPQAMRGELAESFALWTSTIARHTTADDGTEKLLLSLAGGGQIECVLLRDKVRRTLCISTQVGCGMGCVFCASGLDGVDRNLTTGEILEQVLLLQRLLDPQERLSHIVVMGMGEPLANLPALLPALDYIAREDGLGISHRRITVSTVGLPKQIRRLADLDTRYRLAISLHAPNDELRNQIVPVNEKMPLGEILDAADYYFERSGRRLTFEYVLLAKLNDRPEHAHQLVKLLAGRTALVNVIPYNPVAGLPYGTPSSEAQQTFRSILEAGGLAVRFRHRKGDKINAACGQLRRSSNLTDIASP
ncbi:23S rRNA (adenine(2503)-C(2))-methyltransferase RlmN [Aeoliella sp. ICT_H6.2]|uniref:Probable dual-specificity RNA methyltransferase RlmN n=1 Tax=Aeoliella straminimaris TaxID=2954799 RepID=A0A9X2FDS5_9BACT|nr:23S rRNA (adenine(2503)-C(2))-methyltransferase RlmN [Aeoliella straminimaris]MCO6044016.1 23S rRNA (adenine(2503)-C(2))-methyltransferase RlmN [Aeoliella straminimaris]